MPEVSIPSSITDVDAAWLTDVLRGSNAITGEVTSFDTEQVGEGVGIMGQLFRLTLHYASPERGAPGSVIVKLPSPFEENRAQGIALGMYEAEVRFYNEMKATTGTRTPWVHLARIVPGTAEFVVVMEDLAGLHMPDEVAGITVEQAEAAAVEVAKLHASWWGKVGGDEYAWIPTIDAPRIEPVIAVFPMLWEAFAAKFAEYLDDDLRHVGATIAPRWGELMRHFAKRPMTLLHMDYRSENMMFDDGHTVVVLDWQALGRGPGCYDLAYLLGGSLTIENRRAAERDLVAKYHATLVEGGVTDYGLDEAWADYCFGGLLVIATPIFTGGSLDLANERGTALIGGMGKRLLTAVADHQALELMP
jgi:hypothetical protein